MHIMLEILDAKIDLFLLLMDGNIASLAGLVLRQTQENADGDTNGQSSS